MKDSGIEWIGSINSKWPIVKIIYFSKLKTCGTPDKRVLEYWEDGKINWMSSGEINKDLIYEVEGKITELGYKNSNATSLPVN
ncbi:hypothetical protein [Thermoplasma volcanium]|nr:hypothetical protein [Thermoplasma volcanium]